MGESSAHGFLWDLFRHTHERGAPGPDTRAAVLKQWVVKIGSTFRNGVDVVDHVSLKFSLRLPPLAWEMAYEKRGPSLDDYRPHRSQNRRAPN